MFDRVSSTELAAQHVELLPARTVLSTFVTSGDGGTDKGPGLAQGLGSATMSWLGLNVHSQGADGANSDGDRGAVG